MISERIKNLRTNSNMTQNELGLKLGVSPVTISCWESGRKSPSLGAIISLCDLFDISSDSLLGVRNQRNNAENIFSNDEFSLLSKYRKLDKHGRTVVDTVCSLELERIQANEPIVQPRLIKLFSLRPAAGSSAPIDESDYDLIPVADDVPKNAEYSVRISGNSMYPYIADGDIVYVERTEVLRPGDVGIVSVDGSLYCKQYICKEDGTLILASANPDLKHTNVIVKPDANSFVKIFGRVLLDKKVKYPDYLFEDI